MHFPENGTKLYVFVDSGGKIIYSIISSSVLILFEILENIGDYPIIMNLSQGQLTILATKVERSISPFPGNRQVLEIPDIW